MSGRLVAGIDLGATNVRVAIGDLASGIIRKIRRKTIQDEVGDALIEQLVDLLREVAGEELRKVRAVGIGSIGPIDIRRGLILNPPNATFRNVPVVEALSDRLDLPVYLLNDCSTAVLGEAFFGSGRGLKNIFYVTMSSGIGGGAIVDGNLLLGKDGNAVEIGHISVSHELELPCPCGSKNHWEAYCSGRGIPRFVKKLIERWPKRFKGSSLEKLASEDRLTPEILFDMARRGDKHALMVIEEIGKINAIGFANINNLYDPELITIGGAIALNNSELILEPILKHIGEYTVNRIPDIRITSLGEDIVLYGAIVLAAKFEEGLFPG